MLSSRTLFFKNLEVLKVPVFKKGLEFFLKKKEREKQFWGIKTKKQKKLLQMGCLDFMSLQKQFS